MDSATAQANGPVRALAIAPGAIAAFRDRWLAFLPKGTPIDEAQWVGRHRVILGLVWVHVPIILLFGLAMGESVLHSIFEASIVAALGTLATVRGAVPKRFGSWRRSIRATIAGAGLVSSSAILTHLSGGYIEMHFHFFVMVAVMALYQDWPPFLLAITFVATHHGLFGALDPHSVYNHPDALANPWKWAAIHAGFILAASGAAVTAWKYSEQARLATEAANGKLVQTLSLQRATLESTADGILVVDSHGKIATHNQQFARMWGIPADVMAAGDDAKAITFVLDQLKDPGQFIAKVKALYATPDSESHDTLEFLDGRVFERDSKPQRIAGKVVGRVWSFRDVTERRKAEQDRIVAGERLHEIRRLQEVSRFKTQILNTASHELNTPLTPLRLQLHVLQDPTAGLLSERQMRSVRVLDRNLERLSLLVQNVLDVSRLQSDHMKLKPALVDVGLIAHDTLQSFEESARAKGVFLEIEPDAQGAVAVMADADRITQVLFNLVSNALKFTPTNGHVTLGIRAATDKVRIEVVDSGRGLTASEASQLFQPFSQIQLETDVDAPGGTGLGLYICKGIVEGHGGSIGVDSAGRGKGSTFWFDLPLAQAASAA